MEVNGKVYRNLEGQVGYLTDKYDDLQKQINDVRSHLTHYVVVDTLPTGDDIDPSAVYLLGPMGTAPDQYYEEWVYVQKADESWMWEKLGDTDSVDLSGYLQKQTGTTSQYQVYAKAPDGSQTMITASIPANNNAVAIRGANGNVSTAAPTADEHAANKKYVDDNFIAKDSSASSYDQVYGKTQGGVQTKFSVALGAYANTIPVRDGSGRIYTGSPVEQGHAANKQYVDNGFVERRTGTSTYAQAYLKLTDGSSGYIDLAYAAVGDTLVKRTASGQVACADPTDASHAATKNYVDAAVGQLLYLHEIDLRYTISASITLGIKCYLVNGDSTAITSLTRAIFKRITPSYGALNPDASDTVACAITKMADNFRQFEFDEPYASFLYQYYSGGSLTSENTFGITPTVTDVVVSF